MASVAVPRLAPFRADGSENAFHDIQHCCYYDEQSDRTWFAYSKTSSFHPNVSYYDHGTRSFGPTVKVDNNPNNDAHGSPCLFVDSDGYLHIGYGGWGSSLKHAKSSAPRDLSSWSTQVVGSGETYPGFVQSANGDLYYLAGQDGTTSDSSGVYWRSTDGGSSWGVKNTVETITAGSWSCQWIYDSGRNAIHWCLSKQDDNQNWKGIYHWYHDLDDGHMYAMNGHDFGTQITSESDFRTHAVIDEGPFVDGQVEPGDRINLDSNGNPFLAYIYEGSGGMDVQEDENYHHAFARWDSESGSWSTVRDIAVADQRNDAGAIVAISDSELKLYLPNGDGTTGRGGDIELWESSDGGSTWSFVREILSVEADGANLHAPQNPRNHHDEIEILFNTYPHTSSVDQVGQRLYAYGQNGFVSEYSGTPVMFNGARVALNLDRTDLRYFLPFSSPSSGLVPDVVEDRPIGKTENVSATQSSTLDRDVLDFNGTDSSVAFGTQDLGSVDDFHIGFWIRMDSLAGDQVFYSYWIDAMNRIHIGYNGNSGVWIRSEVSDVASTAVWDWSPSAGTWHFVEAMLGTNGSARARVDKTELSTVATGSEHSVSFDDLGSPGAVRVGLREDGANPLDGAIALCVAIDSIDTAYMSEVYDLTAP